MADMKRTASGQEQHTSSLAGWVFVVNPASGGGQTKRSWGSTMAKFGELALKRNIIGFESERRTRTLQKPFGTKGRTTGCDCLVFFALIPVPVASMTTNKFSHIPKCGKSLPGRFMTLPVLVSDRQSAEGRFCLLTCSCWPV